MLIKPNSEQPILVSPFTITGSAIISQGYSAIPIKPEDKAPGSYSGTEWRLQRGWSKWCDELPKPFNVKMWNGWPEAGVGVACGRGLVAIDIDRDELVEPILAVLPPVLVAKKGAKGLTAFYRGNTDAIRSTGFKIEGFTVLDLLAHGKQTVLPPSLHPRTKQPYVWTTQRTLADTPLGDLPQLPDNVREIIADALRPYGYEPEMKFEASITIEDSGSQASDFFRKLNEDALANLDAWVPRLGLSRLTRVQGTWKAVAEWRPSNSGRPLHKRNMNLSFSRMGIKDFGDCGKRYSPIDVVLVSRGWSQSQVSHAIEWLGIQLAYDFSSKVSFTNSTKKTIKEGA